MMNVKAYEDRIRHFVREKGLDEATGDVRAALEDAAAEAYHRGNVGREFYEKHYEKATEDIRKLRAQIRRMDAEYKALVKQNEKGAK